ncbi:cyclin-I [Exaiptasia diaphana]|uniref:Cyclin-like domain-containing protein n=1 Tax=Exaiptasia diaphana TaxID=2652724 RepID=A0A913Y5N5_EXADI|nr:cyclin-I [Exaiptasia diaphana]KXJ22423.1 Cyclin-I [Exaiptasia diaphana]
MCIAPKLNTDRLANVLEENIQKENGESYFLRIFHILQNQGSEITPALYSNTVRWIWLLNHDFEYLPDTFSLTVSILDRFLSLVKAKPKYLRCIAITAYFLAIKTMEEDENIPSLAELVKVSECGCTPSDVLRMERIILSKLQWTLNTTTPLSFLQLYGALVFSSCEVIKHNMAPTQHLNDLTVKLEDCLCNFQFTQFKGSVLALALLSQELESLSPRWLAVVIELQKLTGVDFGELIRCRELIHDVFDHNIPHVLPRKSRLSKPAYKHSLATIPECPEDVFSFLPEHLQPGMQTLTVTSIDSFSADPQPLRDELKRLRNIAVGVLSDEDSTPVTKRRRAELAMACGQQSQQGCGGCTSGVHTLQAVAL